MSKPTSPTMEPYHPYRLATTLVAGMWLWGLALKAHSSIPKLVGHPGRPQSIFSISAALTGVVALSGVIYTAEATENRQGWRYLPISTLIFVLLALLWPFSLRRGRIFLSSSGTRLISTLLRVSVGRVSAQHPDLRFGDNLLADVLTSYAKLLPEIYEACCFLVPSHNGDTRAFGKTFVAPALTAYPFLVRLSQCLLQRQYLNALKYSTAFPPIFIGALLSRPDDPKRKTFLGLWVVFTLINATYSFYWDIFRDWDLHLITNAASPPQERRWRGLTARCYIYIVLDAIGRYAWSVRFTLPDLTSSETSSWVLQLLEVVRRFGWLSLRVQTEQLRIREEGGEDVELLEPGD